METEDLTPGADVTEKQLGDVSLTALKQVVARINADLPEGGTSSGTAFLVGTKHALTCAHCLGEEGSIAEAIELRFSIWDDSANRVAAKALHIDWNKDVALLELDRGIDVPLLPLWNSSEAGAAWRTFGHPKPVGEDGLTFGGTLKDGSAVLYGQHHLQLQTVQASETLAGASGSPIVSGGSIVGMLTHQLLHYTEGVSGAAAPAYSTVYALPVSQMLEIEEISRVLRAALSNPLESLLNQVVASARKDSVRRIDSEGKYVAGRYVPRGEVETGFDNFLKQREKNCFLLIGQAGTGKTNTLSHLALRDLGGPAIFIRGGVDPYSLPAIQDRFNDTILKSAAEASPELSVLDFDGLLELLKKLDQELVIFADAINETEFSRISQRRRELQQLLEYIEGKPIRLVVSCRDIFWTYFIDPRGQDTDFWWRHVFDDTYPERLEKEVERLQNRDMEVVRPNPEISQRDEEKRRKRYHEIAEKQVLHHPSAVLGDFTPEELDAALGAYGVTTQSDDFEETFKQPLLLYFYSELSVKQSLAGRPMRMVELLNKYVEFKIASVVKALSLPDPKRVDALLQEIVSEMRNGKRARIKESTLDDLVAQQQDFMVIRQYLLNEGIILEFRGEDMVGFQFDALFEFMIGRDIFFDAERAEDRKLVFAAAAQEGRQFESVVGALEFALGLLELEHPEKAYDILGSFSEGDPYHKRLYLRAIGSLRMPNQGRLRASLVQSLNEKDVGDEAAEETLKRILRRDPRVIFDLAEGIVEMRADTAARRLSDAIPQVPGLSRRDKIAALSALLPLPSAMSGAAATFALAEVMGLEFGLSRGNHTALSSEEFEPLLAAMGRTDVPWFTKMICLENVLVELIDLTPEAQFKGVLSTCFADPSIVPIIATGTLINVIAKLLEKRSDLIKFMNGDLKKLSTQMKTEALMIAAGRQPVHAEWAARTLVEDAFDRSLLGSARNASLPFAMKLANLQSVRTSLWSEMRPDALQGVQEFLARSGLSLSSSGRISTRRLWVGCFAGSLLGGWAFYHGFIHPLWLTFVRSASTAPNGDVWSDDISILLSVALFFFAISLPIDVPGYLRNLYALLGLVAAILVGAFFLDMPLVSLAVVAAIILVRFGAIWTAQDVSLFSALKASLGLGALSIPIGAAMASPFLSTLENETAAVFTVIATLATSVSRLALGPFFFNVFLALPLLGIAVAGAYWGLQSLGGLDLGVGIFANFGLFLVLFSIVHSAVVTRHYYKTGVPIGYVRDMRIAGCFGVTTAAIAAYLLGSSTLALFLLSAAILLFSPIKSKEVWLAGVLASAVLSVSSGVVAGLLYWWLGSGFVLNARSFYDLVFVCTLAPLPSFLLVLAFSFFATRREISPLLQA